jgi:adenylate cyclase class IV
MQTIEFKAELRDVDAARAQCAALHAEPVASMRQIDTAYRLTDGRLLRRDTPGEPPRWIFYHRPNHVRPRMCNYTLLNDDQARHRWGTQNLKPWLTVAKTRELWALDGVRIHLDEVDDLGTFVEFQADVSRTFDVKKCHRAIARLRETFGPILGEPTGAAYADLVAQREEARER